MKIISFKLFATYLFGVIMILGGINPFIKPAIYSPFIPDFLPEAFTNYLAGFVEILAGVGVFIARYRTIAALAILIMMIIFLPLHILDVFKDQPAIGSHFAAVIRLPIQFVLIVWAWFIYKN